LVFLSSAFFDSLISTPNNPGLGLFADIVYGNFAKSGYGTPGQYRARKQAAGCE
jgi:hypothetical protein